MQGGGGRATRARCLRAKIGVGSDGVREAVVSTSARRSEIRRAPWKPVPLGRAEPALVRLPFFSPLRRPIYVHLVPSAEDTARCSCGGTAGLVHPE